MKKARRYLNKDAPDTNTIVGIVCGIAVAFVWSSWSVATRLAVTTGLGPHDVTFLRFGVSALLLWPILIRNGIKLDQIGPAKLAVMVFGAGVPFMLLGSAGMQFAPASHIATLMIGAMPIWVTVLSKLVFREHLAGKQVIGIFAVATGVAFIGFYSLVSNGSAGEWRGDTLFLIAGLLFACFTIAHRRSGIGAWHATALVNCFSAILFAPIYFFLLRPRLLEVALPDLLTQIVMQGIVVAILGMFFFTQAVRRLGAPRAAIFGAAVPALAAVMEAIILNVWPHSTTVMGICLVAGGVVAVVTSGRQAGGRQAGGRPEDGLAQKVA